MNDSRPNKIIAKPFARVALSRSACSHLTKQHATTCVPCPLRRYAGTERHAAATTRRFFFFHQRCAFFFLGKKGKKKKGVTVDLCTFLADGSGPVPTIPLKSSSWAEDVEDEHGKVTKITRCLNLGTKDSSQH